ncbi:MAG: DUF1289 domain-containing protein [Steroidobacteraceae bacterium]
MNAAEGKLAERQERPPSPCINVCSLDARGLCIGCLRSGDEIARWMAMSAEDQWRLLDELKRRRNLTK